MPSVLDAVRTIVEAGAPGITVHPRADARHITTQDVLDVAAALKPLRGRVEFNIEGDIRPDLMALVHEVQPDQCTLVPVLAGEVTSQGGWPIDTPIPALRGTIAGLRAAGIRVSVFIDPEPAAVRWAAELGADRVELFTEPFAKAFEAGPEATDAAMRACAVAAETAHELGLGVNAGHDLDHRNLYASGSCRISTRCRSATRSSAGRCSTACPRPCGRIWTCFDDARNRWRSAWRASCSAF